MTNKEKYRQFCITEKNIPIFSKDWWLDAVCGVDSWDVILVEKGGQIMASMPYFLKKESLFISISKPMLTKSIGIYIRYPKNQKYYKKLSWEKELITKILESLPKYDVFTQRLDCNNTNILPFFWKDFSLSPKISYVIEDITIEELENNFETNIRRRRRKKAEKIGVTVYESNDIKEFYKLNKQTFIRQKKRIPYSYEFIKKMYNICVNNNSCKMYFAKDKDGTIIAANFLIFDSTTVYYLMGGINPDKKDLGGMDALQHESIKFALQSKRKFDFEGSMIESIEKYFRSFGAQQEVYYEITKINSKLYKKLKALKNIINK